MALPENEKPKKTTNKILLLLGLEDQGDFRENDKNIKNKLVQLIKNTSALDKLEFYIALQDFIDSLTPTHWEKYLTGQDNYSVDNILKLSIKRRPILLTAYQEICGEKDPFGLNKFSIDERSLSSAGFGALSDPSMGFAPKVQTKFVIGGKETDFGFPGPDMSDGFDMLSGFGGPFVPMTSGKRRDPFINDFDTLSIPKPVLPGFTPTTSSDMSRRTSTYQVTGAGYPRSDSSSFYAKPLQADVKKSGFESKEFAAIKIGDIARSFVNRKRLLTTECDWLKANPKKIVESFALGTAGNSAPYFGNLFSLMLKEYKDAKKENRELEDSIAQLAAVLTNNSTQINPAEIFSESLGDLKQLIPIISSTTNQSLKKNLNNLFDKFKIKVDVVGKDYMDVDYSNKKPIIADTAAQAFWSTPSVTPKKTKEAGLLEISKAALQLHVTPDQIDAVDKLIQAAEQYKQLLLEQKSATFGNTK